MLSLQLEHLAAELQAPDQSAEHFLEQSQLYLHFTVGAAWKKKKTQECGK